MNKSKACYLVSLSIVIALSAYPIYMGIVTLSSYIKNGYVDVADYPKYIIPYAPLCIALIIIIAMMPLFIRFFKKLALPAASLLGIAIFIGAEMGFEQIRVLEGYSALPLDSWQYSLCIATPEVLQSIGEPIYAENNPAYKMHFYIIAIVILLAVINAAFGFYNMQENKEADRKKPLIAQLISVAVFISLCILACLTAFWRNGTLDIGPLSAACMIAFFIVFGVTSGTYAGSILYGRKRLVSCFLPAVLAALTTVIMYIGELMLTGGKLFRFGGGFLFAPVGSAPFAPIDFIVILLSGVLTYIIMICLNQQKEQEQQ